MVYGSIDGLYGMTSVPVRIARDRGASRFTLTAREALRHAAMPWDVANVIGVLASDHSSYVTGEVVSVSSERP